MIHIQAVANQARPDSRARILGLREPELYFPKRELTDQCPVTTHAATATVRQRSITRCSHPSHPSACASTV